MMTPRAPQDRFDILVNSVKDYAIFLLDSGGHIATWNTGARLIKGYAAEEAIGKHISIFYTPEDLAGGKPQTLLDVALREGRVEDIGWRLRKDGSRFWADVVITPIADHTGERGFVKVTRDLTGQKNAEAKLRRSEESLAATLYSIGDAVLACDERGRVTRINPVAERLTGSVTPATGRCASRVARYADPGRHPSLLLIGSRRGVRDRRASATGVPSVERSGG